MPQHDLSLGRHFADQPAADHPRYRVSSDLGRVQTRRSWVGPTGNDLSSRVRTGSEPRVGGLRLARGGEPEGGLLQSLDVGITIPSFSVRYTIFARSVCRRHESSAPMAIDRDGSWE